MRIDTRWMMRRHSTADIRTSELATLMSYKAWANRITFEVVAALPDDEALKPRSTRFGSMVHTLNHIWVVEDIFRHHIEGRSHTYTSRNTESPPPLSILRTIVETMDAWWSDYVAGMKKKDLDRLVEFEFVGGGKGLMTQAEIIRHLVNHATYHRGFVGDMLYQAGVTPTATDLPVYLRDIVRQPAFRATA